jgi:hypothetical protein
VKRRPTNSDIEKFCSVDNWERYGGDDHIRFRKRLDDGRVLRTKLSHGGDRDDIGLLTRIVRHQLEVTEEEFWDAVDSGVPPTRDPSGVPIEVQPALPAWLFDNLRRQVGMREEDIVHLSMDEAQKILQAHYSKPHDD